MKTSAFVTIAACALALTACPVLHDDDFRLSETNEVEPSRSDADAGAATPPGPDAEGKDAEPPTTIDGGPDAGFCPATCSAGCAGGTCVIEATGANVTCPAGLPCRVQCTGTACTGSITCAAGAACQVVCTGEDACKGTRFVAGAAASLCVRCEGKQSCDTTTCSAPTTCGAVCSGTDSCKKIGDGCSCDVVSACP